jgi:N-6 DNA Methylase
VTDEPVSMGAVAPNPPVARALTAAFHTLLLAGHPHAEARLVILRHALNLLARACGRHVDSLLLSAACLPALALPDVTSPLSPALLGALFQATMHRGARHERGAHYTDEAAILEHVVRPSLLEPWQARLRRAATPAERLALHAALTRVRILDPACGCGSFLQVAYRALRQLERDMLLDPLSPGPRVSVRQLHGIDSDPLAVELARVTLLLTEETPLPAGALDGNLCCEDALFCAWPPADLILGNPPFQSKNKMPRELGVAAVRRLRARYPGVPGRADYAVYWLRRAHDELPPGGRGGLVGTNTIRQNDSRRGGLDYLVENGGTLTEAVSTMVWPGEAAVHVAVVNWIKGELPGPKRLSWQEGDTRGGPWRQVVVDRIPASLSPRADVTRATALGANVRAGACGQGQTHGHAGFLLTTPEARAMCAASPQNREVLFPYLIGKELLAGSGPGRWVIDFHPRDEREARSYELPFGRVERRVRADREAGAASERRRNEAIRGGESGNRHHDAFLRRWWLLGYPRGELCARLVGLGRYIACSRVTKRPVFELVSAAVHPGDALTVFPLEDDYSFGVLQSDVHAAWFDARCSTMKGDRRYTSSTVFDSFPWPQAPDAGQVAAVAGAATGLRAVRRALREDCGGRLGALYRTMAPPLADAHAALDAAVRAAYGMGGGDPLAFLLELNHACAAREAGGLPIVGPGLPPGVAAAGLVTADAIPPPEL